MSGVGPGAELVLVVGDANPDLVLTGDVVPRFGQAEQLLDGAALTIGGSAAITAHALARLDRPVRLAAAVGPDPLGRQLCDQLAAAGVGLEQLRHRADVATGLTVVLAGPHDRAILTWPGAIPTLDADDVRRAVTAGLAAGLRHVHVASLFLQPTLARALPELLALVRSHGVTTSLDTNDDPAGLWAGVAELLPHVTVLLPNRSEVCAIAREPDAHLAAAKLATAGPLVVVKDGPQGAFCVSAGSGSEAEAEAVFVGGDDVVAVDTTGAGDTFDAAFLDSWLDRAPLLECLTRAVRAGAMAVTAVGGTAGPTHPIAAQPIPGGSDPDEHCRRAEPMSDLSTDLTSAATHVGREIRSQPAAWAMALDRLPDLAGRLPQAGERVAVIGCGTSWFMAAAYASLREGAGLGWTDAFAASQFPVSRAYDRVVAISRSGTTTEVARAIESTRAPVVALTAVPGGPVADAADDTIGLDFADEQSVVQTVFATTVLMLLRGSLGVSLEPVIDQAADVLAGAHPYPAEVEQADQVTFLGQGWAFGLAQEAALKMREAAQLWTEAYPQMEYRHGPISIAQPGRAVWVLGRPVDGIGADIAATGATLVDDDLDPVADLVRAQLLAVRRAEARRLDPDHPRHLTRAVLLGDRPSGS